MVISSGLNASKKHERGHGDLARGVNIRKVPGKELQRGAYCTRGGLGNANDFMIY